MKMTHIVFGITATLLFSSCTGKQQAWGAGGAAAGAAAGALMGDKSDALGGAIIGGALGAGAAAVTEDN